MSPLEINPGCLKHFECLRDRTIVDNIIYNQITPDYKENIFDRLCQFCSVQRQPRLIFAISVIMANLTGCPLPIKS